jgi:hypothetical protein
MESGTMKWIAGIAGVIIIAWATVGAVHRFFNGSGQGVRTILLPSPKDIEKMTVTINDHQTHFEIAPIPEFTVTSAFVPLVLEAFSPAEVRDYGSSCEKDLTFGVVRIKTTTRRTITIAFCDSGKCPVAFSIDGLRCMRGGRLCPVSVTSKHTNYSAEGWLVYYVLRSIHRVQSTGQGRDELERDMSKLRRSHGKLPPERL